MVFQDALSALDPVFPVGSQLMETLKTHQGLNGKQAREQALEDALIRQGYYVLYALITSNNAPSLAFHTAQGFRFLAQFPDCGFKDGAWRGVTWMEKRLRPLSTPPSPPKTTKEEPPC